MSWNLMLNPWQLALFLAIPPAIVLLYFLKLKRQPLEVPSTYLWRRSIEDLRVNSIWQRLRRNLLLLLQLLILALALLALLRPSWKGSTLDGDRFIFLIDNSASMSARDVEPSRLERAKREVASLIDAMRSGDVGMVISFADSARVEQGFTDNRRQLQRGLERIAPTDRATSLHEALRVAAGLANPGKAIDKGTGPPIFEGLPATIYIFSDGKFPDVQGVSLGNLTPKFIPIGDPAAANVGITAFSTRRSEAREDLLQAFARIENAGPADLQVEVQLDVPDRPPDYSQVTIKAKGSAGVVFELPALDQGALKLTVRPGGALGSDDVAWAAVNPVARRKVLLVTPENVPLEKALGTRQVAEKIDLALAKPAALAGKEYQAQASAGDYDLVIYDRCRPEEMPQANTLFIGAVPKLPDWSAGPRAAAPQVLDVESAHPIMQWIDLGNVKFAEGTPLKGPTGARVLIDSDAGPLLVIAPRQGFEDAVLGVELVGVNDQGESVFNTDWPLWLSFPLFVLNTLEYLTGSNEMAAAASVQPGQPLNLRSESRAGELTVRNPAGKSVAVPRSRQHTYLFSGTDQLGAYEVLEKGRLRERFVVNLFDSRETDIAPRHADAIVIGYNKVQAQASWEGGRREVWKWLLLGVLAVLSAEWYIYNRRVYI